MAGGLEFDVVEYPRESLRTDYKDYFRVYVALGVLKALELEKGDPCILNVLGNPVGTVLVWELVKNSRTKELQISKRLQSLYGVSQGAKVLLSRVPDPLPSAAHITLLEVTSSGVKSALPKLREEDLSHWAWLLEEYLYRAETISPGMVIEGVEAKFQKRSFKILLVNDSPILSPRRFEQSCKVEVISEHALGNGESLGISDRVLTVPTDGIGGLEAQLKKIGDEIDCFGNIDDSLSKFSSLPDWTNGIILFGPPGTGKTLLLRKIAKAGWRGIFDLGAELSKHPPRGSKALGAMKDLFADAKKCQPSIILLDNLEKFAADDNTHSPAQDTTFIDTLSQEVERLSSFRSLVVAATRSIAKINPELRNVDVFSNEIEIPVPNSNSRASILKALCDRPLDTTDALLEKIASRTHGFVGEDLRMLLDHARKKASIRTKATEKAKKPVFSKQKVQEQDFDVALQEVKPRAIRGVFVEIPETRWDHIGGHQDVKNILNKALIWPSTVSTLSLLNRCY